MFVCVCVCEGGVNKSMKFSNFLGHIFLTTPLYLHTEMFSLGIEEEIRTLYFDDKIGMSVRRSSGRRSGGGVWAVDCWQ